MARYTKTQRKEAREVLAELLKPGDRIYTILRHCSASGMSRIIDLVIARDNEIRTIGWVVAQAIDQPFTNEKFYGVKVAGCGMDMGFSLVYDLGRTLYPNGFKLAEGQRGRNGDTSGIDTDGGYAFTQEWV